jgi:bifunctional DNA-binding transcriptional regulator/antitoxin component of YhaV-PrlF toxin-antitoxin module
MKITSVQKVIKVGSSLAVTIPAKDAEYSGVKAGDLLEVTYEKSAPDAHQVEVVELTQKLIKRHKRALKNLSQR